LKLNKVFTLQASLHDKLIQLNQSLVNEINSEFGSLFAEKKYKELIAFAKA